MRRLLLQFGAAALVVCAVVALAGSVIIRNTARQEAVHAAAELSDALAGSVVQPALRDAMQSDPAAAVAGLDTVVRNGLLSQSIVRVKLWNPQGTIVYSDERRLIGQSFQLDAHARAALTTPHTTAVISDVNRPENQYERNWSKLLEVYRPVWTPNGSPLLLELYFPYDLVTTRTAQLWRGFGGIMVSTIAAVFALLFPLAWALTREARHAQIQRERLLKRAADASTQEGRRIAASLHDGVVQELAAASFAVSAAADTAETRGDRALAERLDAAAATVRSSVAGLRALLVDVYPPALHNAGLAATLRDLAGLAAGRDLRVDVTVDEAVAQALSPAEQDAVFRIAQECARNSVNHASATQLGVRLQREGDAAVLTVTDDGVGFAPGDMLDSPAEGHLGLRLIGDAARAIDARLEVHSEPGAGTSWRLVVPT